MKSLVTGVKGQLGYDIVRELEKRGYEEIVGIDYEEMDITDKEQVMDTLLREKPEVVFHCAAYTAVDQAEEQTDTCILVNAIGTENIVMACKLIGAKIIYISTDYVFSGEKDGFYEVEDVTSPQSVYGKSKYQGEEAVRTYDNHFIVRISWVFGIHGNNFVKTMLKLAEIKTELSIINDQVGSPTYTVDLSKLLVDMAETTRYGTYHATNENTCSWAEFAKEIFLSNQIDMNIKEIASIEYPQKAKRPRNSKMSKQKLTDNGFEKLPTWQDALYRYNTERKQNKGGIV